MHLFKKTCLIIFALFFLAGGINHFLNPLGYLKLIPPYLPFPQMLNYLSGLFEITFGLMLFHPKTRNIAAWGIILILAAFIPAHVYMIQIAPFMLGKIQVTVLIAWLRLLVQFMLMGWAYYYTNNRFNKK